MSDREKDIVASTFHVINDIERIGDHAENVADLASQRINRDLSYSSDAMEELYEIYNYTVNALEISIESYSNRDVEKDRSIRAIESRINSSQKKFRDKHIKRLYDGKCNAYAGAIFLDLISNFERIGDHSIESRINSSQKKFRDKHIKRLYDGKCNAYAGAIFLDLISNFERIGDHSTNIAESVIENYSA